MYPYKFIFNPKENENIDAYLENPNENECIIHGLIQDKDKSPIKSAVVRLSEKTETVENHLAYIITDDDGEFVYGPIDEKKKFIIKVWIEKAIVRDVVISPKS